MYLPNFENCRPSNIRKVAKSQFNSYAAPVDQFDGQDFNFNDCGFIRNDISQLMRSQSQAEYDMKLKMLTEIPSSSIPDNVSVTDAISYIIPRYTQSPAELSYFAELLARKDINKMSELRVKRALNDKAEQPANVESNSEQA